jgi:tetratricopeptide (TPR) repeat protein
VTTPVETSFRAGVAALRDGRADEAQRQFQDVLAADPDHAATLYNLGVLQYQAGRSADAETYLQRAVECRPGHTDTRSVLAAVLVDLNKLHAALPHARVIAESPVADSAALNTAGHVLALAGWSEDAEAVYRRALGPDNAYRPSATGLVTLLMSRRDFAEAARVCGDVLARHPTDQDLHLKRAQALWEGGHTNAARDALTNLLDFAPDHVTAHHNLSLFAGVPDPETRISRLTSLLGEGVLETPDVVKAWFALGNLFATLSQPEESLACFTEGNCVRAVAATALHTDSSLAFEHRVNAVVAAPLPPVQDRPARGPTPLIISGPSRSGKSLIQSWLSGHPDITAADEVGVLPRLAEIDFKAEPARLEEAAATYRSTLVKLGGPARYVIDTHPTNALYLDLLLQLCPDAKIIQINRGPLDLAVSIFARNFVTGGHWADSWRGIAARLKCYDRLQTHWADWSPVIATLAYEDVVRDPDSTLATLTAALELPPADAIAPPAPAMSASEISPMPWASFADRPSVQPGHIGLWRPFAPCLAAFADAYGRDSVADQGVIPVEIVAPYGAVVNAVHSLKTGDTPSGNAERILKNIPASHAAAAEQAAQAGRWDDAVAARWQAVSCRPFTHRVRHHADALQNTLESSPLYQDVARLHKDVSALWVAYREESGLRFGDFGLLYQSCGPALLAGSRDTEVRAAAYDLETLCAGQRVLDLGANTGFLSLAAASHAATVRGIEHEQALVDIGSRVRDHLHLDNCTFLCADASVYDSDEPFDVVIAAAVHGWLQMPLADFALRLAGLTAPGGAVLFESQGQRSTTVIEEGFHAKTEVIVAAGFQVERHGTVCDDHVNLRAFVVLRKDS